MPINTKLSKEALKIFEQEMLMASADTADWLRDGLSMAEFLLYLEIGGTK